MHPLSFLMILVLGGAILFLCIPRIFKEAAKKKGSRRYLIAAGGMFMAVGVIGFFGSGVSALGGLNWMRPSFEWPIGYTTQAVTTKHGLHIVPHTPSGRVQVYDAKWKFLRGWHVDASGGTFKLTSTNSNTVDLITARGNWQYVFDFEGKLLSKSNYDPSSYSKFPDIGEFHVVPTAPWLWLFTNPFLSWGTAVSGMILLIIEKKMKKRRNARKPSNSASQPS